MNIIIHYFRCTLSSQLNFTSSRAFVSVFLQPKAIIGIMHDFNLAMGAQSLREGHRRILTGTVVATVAHPRRELLIVRNKAIHRGRSFSVGVSEVSIVSN